MTPSQGRSLTAGARRNKEWDRVRGEEISGRGVESSSELHSELKDDVKVEYALLQDVATTCFLTRTWCHIPHIITETLSNDNLHLSALR